MKILAPHWAFFDTTQQVLGFLITARVEIQAPTWLVLAGVGVGHIFFNVVLGWNRVVID